MTRGKEIIFEVVPICLLHLIRYVREINNEHIYMRLPREEWFDTKEALKYFSKIASCPSEYWDYHFCFFFKEPLNLGFEVDKITYDSSYFEEHFLDKENSAMIDLMNQANRILNLPFTAEFYCVNKECSTCADRTPYYVPSFQLPKKINCPTCGLIMDEKK